MRILSVGGTGCVKTQKDIEGIERIINMAKKDTVTENSVDELIGKLFFPHIDSGNWSNTPLDKQEDFERGLDSMKKIPWYPWYLDDYISSEKVDLLSMEEEGIYRRLLDRAWHRPDTALPLDIDILCRLSKNSPADKVTKVIKEFFIQTDKGYINKRLRIEREKAEKIYAAKVKGANKRWGKTSTSENNDTDHDGVHNTDHDAQHDGHDNPQDSAKNYTKDGVCISQPQPQPQPQEPNTKEAVFDFESEFEKRWTRYPNKDGRKEALKHFKATVTVKNITELDRALDNYLTHLALPKNSFKNPKNGKTWFNNWQDWINWIEPEVKSGNGKAVRHTGTDQKQTGFGIKPKPGEFDRAPKFKS